MAEENTQTKVTETRTETKKSDNAGSNPVLMILIVGLLVVGGFYFYNQMSKSDAPVTDDELVVDEDEQMDEESTTEEENLMGEESALGEPMERVENSIIEVATDAGTFNTLLVALSATGLDEVLSAEGEYTVFAPTDDAFAKLPAETLEGLLADPQALADVLKFHVAAGKMNVEDLTSRMEVASLQGGFLKFTVNPDGTVDVNGVRVVNADIEAANGVIHVLDTVLLPEGN